MPMAEPASSDAFDDLPGGHGRPDEQAGTSNLNGRPTRVGQNVNPLRALDSGS
jgi:hypothetical protein